MTEQAKPLYREHLIHEYIVEDEPFYIPVEDEIELFEAAYAEKVPVLLKGPTGCGKTRFVEYMSYRIGKQMANGSGQGLPLVTVACHEDLTASDLVGRYLLEGDGTHWFDGPLTRAVKHGAICYLDEVIEARKDTAVIIHPLTDHRRLLHMEKLGQVVEANPNFLLVISYNPGYQSALKDLKHSTRQRFIAIEFGFAPRELEVEVIVHESGTDKETASALALLGEKIRHLKGHGLQEAASTRLLIYVGKLMVRGVSARRACQVAIVWSLTDDEEIQRSVTEVVNAVFP